MPAHRPQISADLGPHQQRHVAPAGLKQLQHAIHTEAQPKRAIKFKWIQIQTVRTCSISYIGVSADNLGKSRNGMSRTYTVLAGSTSTSSFDRSRPMMSFLHIQGWENGRWMGGGAQPRIDGRMGSGWYSSAVKARTNPGQWITDHWWITD